MSRVIVLSNSATVLLNVAGWAIVHAGTGYAAHRLRTVAVAQDTWLTRLRPWEREGRVYERVGVRRWKDRLPEAGALFRGGVSKRCLPGRGETALAAFGAETRRAEYAHWMCAAGSPLFLLWNAPAVAAVMVLYGAAVNAPFIVIQRFNRGRVLRVSCRRTSGSTST